MKSLPLVCTSRLSAKAGAASAKAIIQSATSKRMTAL
jgi:hypothetical protein